MSRTAYYVVDRIEGTTAAVIGDDQKAYDVPTRELPNGVAEDAVLRVSLKSDGKPDWKHAVIDTVERNRRIAGAREIYDELRKEDPGGDVKL